MDSKHTTLKRRYRPSGVQVTSFGDRWRCKGFKALYISETRNLSSLQSDVVDIKGHSNYSAVKLKF
jgi:hypothetical protein